MDFGCGSGKLMQVAEASGAAEVVGIENNPRARQEARDLGFRVVSNIGDLGQEQFDILYLNDVIEHLRDPVETCAALRTHLSPGGALFVATINCASLKARLLGPRWDMYIDPTHFYYFRRSSLIQVLREAGYEEIQPLNFTVVFSHHGPLRRQLQHLLVALGLDSSIKIIAVSPVDVSLKER
ncbi:MAG: class I SAM-dependent methyltransferase [Alphaproteobacteria bacterium]|nr:class I SAM-dependent methyltransferase [Alphaproteobacteria bacterium]